MLKRGIQRIRRSLLYNALSTTTLTLVFVLFFVTIGTDRIPLMVSLVCTGWLWFCIFTIAAIVYQYGGAIDIYRGVGREGPSRPGSLRLSAVLIMVDPLFNLLSGAGMFMIPFHHMDGPVRRKWIAAIPLFFSGTLMSFIQFLYPMPDPGTPVRSLVAPLLFSLVSMLLVVGGYVLLYMVYRDASWDDLFSGGADP